MGRIWEPDDDIGYFLVEDDHPAAGWPGFTVRSLEKCQQAVPDWPNIALAVVADHNGDEDTSARARDAYMGRIKPS